MAKVIAILILLLHSVVAFEKEKLIEKLNELKEQKKVEEHKIEKIKNDKKFTPTVAKQVDAIIASLEVHHKEGDAINTKINELKVDRLVAQNAHVQLAIKSASSKEGYNLSMILYFTAIDKLANLPETTRLCKDNKKPCDEASKKSLKNKDKLARVTELKPELLKTNNELVPLKGKTIELNGKVSELAKSVDDKQKAWEASVAANKDEESKILKTELDQEKHKLDEANKLLKEAKSKEAKKESERDNKREELTKIVEYLSKTSQDILVSIHKSLIGEEASEYFKSVNEYETAVKLREMNVYDIFTYGLEIDSLAEQVQQQEIYATSLPEGVKKETQKKKMEDFKAELKLKENDKKSKESNAEDLKSAENDKLNEMNRKKNGYFKAARNLASALGDVGSAEDKAVVQKVLIEETTEWDNILNSQSAFDRSSHLVTEKEKEVKRVKGAVEVQEIKQEYVYLLIADAWIPAAGMTAEEDELITLYGKSYTKLVEINHDIANLEAQINHDGEKSDLFWFWMFLLVLLSGLVLGVIMYVIRLKSYAVDVKVASDQEELITN